MAKATTYVQYVYALIGPRKGGANAIKLEPRGELLRVHDGMALELTSEDAWTLSLALAEWSRTGTLPDHLPADLATRD